MTSWRERISFGLDRPGRPRQIALFVAGMGGVEVLGELVYPHRVPQGEVIFGAILGVVYALIAVSLILVYQSNRIINFAVAEFGILGAIVSQNLQAEKVPWVLDVVVGVLVATASGYLMERFLARRFASASRLILTVATIGMAQFVAFAEIEVSKHFGTIPASAGLRTPLSGLQFSIGGVTFNGNYILLVAMAAGILVGLELFLHRSDYGIALRGAAENAPRASLLGVPVRTVSTLAWTIAALIAGIATVFRSPITGVVAGGTVVGPALLYKALAVAVVADFTDFPIAIMAGIFLGALEQSISYSFSQSTVTDVVYVVVIIAVLLFRKQRYSRIIEGVTSSWRSIREVRRVPRAVAREPRVLAVRAGAVGLAGLALVAGPLGMSGAHRFDASEVVIFAIVAISCVVVTGWTGQISLGQFALAAVGAVTSAKLFAQAHWDFLASLIAAGIVAALVSMLLGLVATRVRGFFFAVTSLGFAIALESFFLNPRFFSPLVPSAGFLDLNRPVLFGHIRLDGDLAYYYLCLVVLLLVGLSTAALRRSRTGRVLIAVKDNDRAASSYGVSRARSLLTSFAVSGFIAGIGGCLFAFHAQALTPGDYTAEQSVLVFSMAVIGGLGSVPSAAIGAMLIEGWGFAFSQNQALDALVTGAGLTVVLLFIPEGIGSVLYRLRDLALGPFSPERLLVPLGQGTEVDPVASGIPSGLSPDDPRLAGTPPPPPVAAGSSREGAP